MEESSRKKEKWEGDEGQTEVVRLTGVQMRQGRCLASNKGVKTWVCVCVCSPPCLPISLLIMSLMISLLSHPEQTLALEGSA